MLAMQEQRGLGGCWSRAFGDESIVQFYLRGSTVKHANQIGELDLPFHFHQEQSFYPGSKHLFESTPQILDTDAFVPDENEVF
jgi:hypothetical protein